MAAKTLLEFRKSEEERLAKALEKWRKSSEATSKAKDAATVAAANAATAVDDALTKRSAILKACAAMPSAAEGRKLVKNLGEATVAWTEATARQITADAERLKAANSHAIAGREVELYAGALAEAKTALEAEETSDKERKALVKAVESGPAKDHAQAAGDALNQFEKNATKNVESEFPKANKADRDFLKRVRARAGLAGEALNIARDSEATAAKAQQDWQATVKRESTATAKLQAEFDVAVEALRAFANAAPRLEQASAALKELATTPSLVKKEQVQELADRQRSQKREAALASLTDRDDKLQAYYDKVAAFEKELAAQRKAAPGLTDGDLVKIAKVAAAKKDRDAAKDDVDQADTQLAKGDRAVLVDWFAAVPPELWDRLEALDRSVATLREIRDAKPDALVRDVANAEKALVDNLVHVAAEQELERSLPIEIERSRRAVADERDLESRRRQAASRYSAAI